MWQNQLKRVPLSIEEAFFIINSIKVMAQSYYVNKNAQPGSNDHEVHVVGCSYFPAWENVISLGLFESCGPAVQAAKRYFNDTNGCYYCCNRCHTT
jgi:hypothetical protein